MNRKTGALILLGTLLVMAALLWTSALQKYGSTFWQDTAPIKHFRDIQYDRELSTVVDKCSTSPDCYLYEAGLQGGYKTVVYLNAGIKMLPRNPRLLMARADIRVNNFKKRYSQDLRLASEDYLNVIYTSPKDFRAHLGYCRTAAYSDDMSAEMLKQARASCEFAIAESSNSAAEVEFYKGMMAMSQSRFGEATSIFSESIRLNPDAIYPDASGTFLPIYNFRAKAYMAANNMVAAKADYEMAINKMPEGASWADLAYLQIKTGDELGAKNSLERLSVIETTEVPNNRKQGLKASFAWVFHKDSKNAVETLYTVTNADPYKLPEGFFADDYKEFLSTLFERQEYTAPYGLSSRLRSDGFLVRPQISTAAAEVSSYRISGVCQRIDISSQSSEGGQYDNDFVVVMPTVSISTSLSACSRLDMQNWVDFALVDAERGVAVDYDESINWRGIRRIVGLAPEKCSVLKDPESKRQLAIMEFKLDAVRPSSDESYKLLSMITLDERALPRKTLFQNASVETVTDNNRIISVWDICDTNGDSLAEVILRDERYAGYGWNVLRFKSGYSAIEKEEFGGVSGYD